MFDLSTNMFLQSSQVNQANIIRHNNLPSQLVESCHLAGRSDDKGH
jgi:hypothetical protein